MGKVFNFILDTAIQHKQQQRRRRCGVRGRVLEGEGGGYSKPMSCIHGHGFEENYFTINFHNDSEHVFVWAVPILFCISLSFVDDERLEEIR